ncbi:MAG TPA: PH domain-containing protein [Nocardioides sp.]|uniref:PH domain-containing protein n=1 Tax=Nocardioides sp. TaxID=35761 RepID=UPI002BA150DF|nr:PH domain-containing protein [Nocardioides sp.]HQR27247.1 PH domain-containing protein [Nocardioides sp.]
MPADSETPPPLGLPHTWRPLGVRLAGGFFGAMLLLVCLVMWFNFDPEVRAAVTIGQRLTLLGFGLMAAAAMHALMRCRVTASADRLVVVNGYRRREFTWPQVVAVSLPAGAPWATLDLSDGTSVPAMGIQGSDGHRARTAVSELRSLLDR